jgi:ketosteroid isomerase-like protein
MCAGPGLVVFATSRIEGAFSMNKISAHAGALARGAVLAIGVSSLFAASASAAGPDKNAVLAANAGFYKALNIMFTGNSAPMEAVWSHAEDVTYMGPTGDFDRGWASVQKNWRMQATMKLGGKVEPADMHVIFGQDIVVVSDYEQGENTNAKGKVAKVKLRATNIFRMEGGQWKMVGHHTDTLPYLSK